MDGSLSFRFSEDGDESYLKEWMSDPQIFRWFPMDGEKEVDYSVRIWIDCAKRGQGITALWDGVPCGMTVLDIQFFKKLSHTCLLSILVAEAYRNRGIGKALIEHLIDLAKNTFRIEILHLEVYGGNPARHLYERLGFVPFGEHKRFAKEEGGYRSKVFMQKYLL